MPITIQEIIASDTISQLVDKTNFNFDQLLLNGGGPAGPAGTQGPTGPAGGRGPKGSTWYEDTATSAPGTTPTASFPTTTPLSGDYYLQFNGVVWEYTGLAWSQTTIDLEGPQGPQGPGGGMGDLFGGPTNINQETAIYNGTIGLGNGASTLNQGVATVLIGGVPSTATALVGIGLTNAYIVPDEIAIGAQSNNVALLIHQKDSGSKAIVFQGGGAIPSENYWQGIPGTNSEMTNLSNINIGEDDRLILEVPKVATSPVTSLDDLIGIQLNSPTKTQSFTAGKAINFATGQRQTSDWVGENSDFKINVGVGSTPGGNQFSLTTAGSAGSTLMELGTGFSMVQSQTAQVGDAQIRAGKINLVSSVNLPIQLFSGGPILLNTISGSNAAGNIQLASGSGGILLDTNSTGNITIQQSNASVSNTGDIIISNASTAPNATQGGDIYIQTNSQTILKKSTETALDNCSIVIDYGYDGSAGAQPHTRFVGKQTIATSGLGTGTFPPDGFANLIYKNPTNAATTAGGIYELTGNDSVIDMAGGVMLQAWQGGTQTATGVSAGLVGVVLGSEATNTGGNIGNNSLGIAVRSKTSLGLEFFNANNQHTSFASPIVNRRSTKLDSALNLAPYNDLRNSSLGSASFIDGTIGGWGPYGINTLGTNPTGGAQQSTGMPTTADIGAAPPFVQITFAPCVNLPVSGTSGPATPTNNVYDYNFNFPIGQYPGQRMQISFKHFSYRYSFATFGSGIVTQKGYGNLSVRIPRWRRRSTSVGNGNFSSWWSQNIPPGKPSSFTEVILDISDAQATENLVKNAFVTMVWDGSYSKQDGNNSDAAFGQPSVMTTEIQWGWQVEHISTTGDASLSFVPAQSTCFIAGTEIMLSNGDVKNIEDVVIGDHLLSSTGGVSMVLAHDRPLLGERKLYSFNGGTAFVTSEHPFMTNDGWKSIDPIALAEENNKVAILLNITKLAIGDSIMTDTGSVIVESIEEHGGDSNQTLYNFELDGDHTYYADSYLTHNKGN